MRALFLFIICTSPLAFAQRSLEDTLPAYSKAYDTAFRSLGRVELSDTQTRIKRLGDAGKPLQAELDALRGGQGEVSDRLVKAVGLKKQALAEKKPTGVEEGTKVLADAEAKAQRLIASLKSLHEKLTAAGAPEIKTPERDPDARD
jgi:hypothetical protein